MAKNPDHYYDTAKFRPPVTLQDPDQYISTPSSIFLLHGFFKDTSASAEPFQFRLKTDSSQDSQDAQQAESRDILHEIQLISTPIPSPSLIPLPTLPLSPFPIVPAVPLAPLPASPLTPLPTSPLTPLLDLPVTPLPEPDTNGTLVAGPSAEATIAETPAVVAMSNSVAGTKSRKQRHAKTVSKPTSCHSLTTLDSHSRKSARKRKEPDTTTVAENAIKAVKRKK